MSKLLNAILEGEDIHKSLVEWDGTVSAGNFRADPEYDKKFREYEAKLAAGTFDGRNKDFPKDAFKILAAVLDKSLDPKVAAKELKNHKKLQKFMYDAEAAYIRTPERMAFLDQVPLDKSIVSGINKLAKEKGNINGKALIVTMTDVVGAAYTRIQRKAER